MKASFAQIYKEEVHDLLSYSEATGLATLPIREDTNGGITLTGQQHRVVRGHADAVALLAEGGRNRATGATSMNATSSPGKSSRTARASSRSRWGTHHV